jgi:hypothetical protein
LWHVCRNPRKQAQPQRKAVPADPRLLLGLLPDDEQAQQHAGTLGALLQHMSAAGVNMAPAAGSSQGAPASAASAAAAAAGAGAVGVFNSDPVKLQQVQELVGEDVQRLAQDWRQHEGHKLQAGAGDIWTR